MVSVAGRSLVGTVSRKLNHVRWLHVRFLFCTEHSFRKVRCRGSSTAITNLSSRSRHCLIKFARGIPNSSAIASSWPIMFWFRWISIGFSSFFIIFDKTLPSCVYVIQICFHVYLYVRKTIYLHIYFIQRFASRAPGVSNPVFLFTHHWIKVAVGPIWRISGPMGTVVGWYVLCCPSCPSCPMNCPVVRREFDRKSLCLLGYWSCPSCPLDILKSL